MERATPREVVVEVVADDDASLQEYLTAMVQLDGRVRDVSVQDLRRYDGMVDGGQHRLVARIEGAIVAAASISRMPYDDSTRELSTCRISRARLTTRTARRSQTCPER